MKEEEKISEIVAHRRKILTFQVKQAKEKNIK